MHDFSRQIVHILVIYSLDFGHQAQDSFKSAVEYPLHLVFHLLLNPDLGVARLVEKLLQDSGDHALQVFLTHIKAHYVKEQVLVRGLFFEKDEAVLRGVDAGWWLDAVGVLGKLLETGAVMEVCGMLHNDDASNQISFQGFGGELEGLVVADFAIQVPRRGYFELQRTCSVPLPKIFCLLLIE